MLPSHSRVRKSIEQKKREKSEVKFENNPPLSSGVPVCFQARVALVQIQVQWHLFVWPDTETPQRGSTPALTFFSSTSDCAALPSIGVMIEF